MLDRLYKEWVETGCYTPEQFKATIDQSVKAWGFADHDLYDDYEDFVDQYFAYDYYPEV